MLSIVEYTGTRTYLRTCAVAVLTIEEGLRLYNNGRYCRVMTTTEQYIKGCRQSVAFNVAAFVAEAGTDTLPMLRKLQRRCTIQPIRVSQNSLIALKLSRVYTCPRRYFQYAHFIPIVGVGKRGVY